MEKADINKLLDEIDEFMFNNLDKNKKIIPEIDTVKIEEKLADLQFYIEKNSELYERYQILVNAFQVSKTEKTNNKEEKDQAIIYYNWMDDVVSLASGKKYDYQSAIKSEDLAKKTGHEVDLGIKRILKNRKNLPRKTNFFDKIKKLIHTRIIHRSKENKKNGVNIKNTPQQETDSNPKDEVKAKSNPQKEMTSRRKNKEFIQRNRVTENTIRNNMQNKAIKMEHEKNNKKSVVVVSDIHGNIQKWNCVKEAMNRNNQMKLIILGDAMDRGPYGLQILLQMKELCDSGKAEYLPGNHDAFAYNALAMENTEFEDYETIELSKQMWEKNGGKITINSFNNFDNIMNMELQSGRITKPIAKQELINWLGQQPIQKKVKEDGVDYALAHAMFDEELYQQDPNFNLEKELIAEINNEDHETINRFRNCMWFREDDENTKYADVAFPEGNVVICGHTTQPDANMKYLDNDINKPMIYIDCGKGLLQGYDLIDKKHIELEKNNSLER